MRCIDEKCFLGVNNSSRKSFTNSYTNDRNIEGQNNATHYMNKMIWQGYNKKISLEMFVG